MNIRTLYVKNITNNIAFDSNKEKLLFCFSSILDKGNKMIVLVPFNLLRRIYVSNFERLVRDSTFRKFCKLRAEEQIKVANEVLSLIKEIEERPEGKVLPFRKRA